MKKIIRNYNRVKTSSKRRGKPNAVEEQPKQSSVLERYPRVFVESVREPSLPLPYEKGSTMEGDGNAEERISDSEFDFLPVAGQMKLSNIQKAQIKRERGKCMEELMSVLARVRLAVDEYNIAEDELKVSESPDPEFEAEEEEKRKRERKIRREQRRALRKIGRQEGGEEKEKGDQDGTQELQTENEDEIESLGSDEESSELSLSMSDEDDEEEENDEPNEEEIKETREEIWAMGGEVKQQISNTMLMRRSKRRRVLKLITSYLELCVEREDIMRQMQLWIESTVDEELMKPARVFLFSPDLLLDDLPLGLTSEMQDLSAALARLKTIADSLGIGVSETADVDESSEKTVKSRAPRKTVYSVDELDNADNWIQAETDVETIIGQAIAAIPVRKIRLNLENAKKQFVLMNQLVARRNVHIRKLEEKGVDLEGELAKTKRHNDELRKTNKKAKVKTEKLQYQNEDLQHNLKEQQKMISELNEKLDEYKRKESYGLYRSSNESMASLKDSKESMSVVSLVEKPSQQLAPTGEKVMIKTPKSSKVQIVVASDSTESEEAAKPEPSTQTSEESKKEIAELKERLERVEEELKIEKEKSAAFEQEFASLQSDKVKVEQERSELEIQLEDVKRENERAVEELNQNLEDMERENKRLTGEIECNEEMIKYQEERLGQFMEEIQSLEERMMSFPPTPATMSVASMAGGARRERRKTSLQLGLEPQTARQMVAKVKQQYEAELQSLKDHMNKETQRHQAELRRLEQDHKKDVQNIHKEALLLLRALNRFKDSVATLLDREHLSQEAHAIRSHAPLPLDENFGDTRQMLARMAILSNEMLISVELHLSRGLMSKRLEMKDTHLGKMDHPGDALRKSREIGRQKGTMGDLQIQGQQLELHVWRLLEEGRRQDVMERFRDLQTQLSSQEKEVLTIKKTDEEKMKKKEAQLKRVLRRESDVKKTVDEQKTIIKNLASIWKSRRIGQKYIRRDDQLRNLKLLEEAMKEHEVSKELFESTKKMIKDAMDFPRKRFIELVKKYVHFRRVKEIQENVQKMKMESSINERVLLAMQEAEERMVKQKEAWKEKKEQLIKARADILEQLYQVLSQVHEETGVLLVKPMDLIPRLEQIKEDVKEINQADILAAANIPKERAKLRKAELLAHAASVAKEQTISGVEGMGITSDVDQGSTWKVMSSFPTAMITTPRLLDMDINRTRHAAHDILARVSQGSLEPKSVSLPPINFFPSLYGYFGKPTAIRKARSEPVQQRKKIVTSLRSRVRFLPPIATLYPEQLEDHNEES